MSTQHKFTYTIAVPLNVAWQSVRKGSQLQPKLLPAFFAKIDVLQGDGGAGSVRVVTLGEGVGPEGAGKQVKERVDVMDDATHTLVYSIIEGGDPRYNDVQNTLKFSGAGNSTNVEWTVKYTPASSDIPPPAHLEGFAQAASGALEKYVKEHPTEFA